MAVFTAAAAGTLLGSTFLSSAFIAATQLVLGVALNMVTQELFGPDDDKQRTGIVGTMQLGADVPRSVIFGRYTTRGSLVYQNQWGHTSGNNADWLSENPLDPPTIESNNDYYTRVTALSDAQLSQLTALVIDGKWTAIDWDNPDTDLGRGFPLTEFTVEKEWTTFDTTGGLADGFSPDDAVVTGSTTTTYQLPRAWVKFYDGTQTTADPFVQNMVSTAERPWTSLHVLRGMAYAVVTFRYDEELFKRLPDIKYVVEGMPLHDPRTGATATFSANRNPILMMRALTKGITVEGQWLYGAQQPVLLDDTEINAMANLCDANPPGWTALTAQQKTDIYGTTDPVPRYRAGAEILVDTPIAEALEQIGLSCNAVFADTGSHLRILVGEETTPTFSITDGDFRSTKEQNFNPFPPLAEAINGITATYPSPVDLWEVQDAPPLYNATYEAEDDDRRLVRNVDLITVPWAEQVQRLMKAAMAEARRARTNVGTLPASYWDINPGDYIEYQSTRNGYPADKIFRVSAVAALADGDVSVSLLEMDPDAYAWTPSTDYVSPPASDYPAILNLPAVTINDFTVKPSYVQDGDGTPRRPAILLQFDNPDQPGAIKAIRYQVRLAASGRIVTDGATSDLEAEAHLISENILPLTAYEVRIRTQGPRNGTWTAYKPVTTLDIRLSEKDLRQELQDRFDAAFERHDAALETIYSGNVAELLAEVRINDAIIAARAVTDSATAVIMEEATGDSFAAVATDITLITTEQSAQATQINTVIAETNANAAAIVSEQTARTTADSAIASDVTALTSRVDDTEADISVINSTKVNAAGAVAAIEAEISATYNGLTAMATATQFAESTVDGISSGFVWDLGAGDVLSLVRVDDGVTAPATTARLKADYIKLDGNVEVTNDFLANKIFATEIEANKLKLDGVTLTGNGSGQLIINGQGVDTAQIKNNAVSNFNFAENNNPINVTNTAWVDLIQMVLTCDAGDVRLDFSFEMESNTASTQSQVNIKFLRNGSDITVARPYRSGSDGNRISHMSPKVATGTGSGAITFKVQIQKATENSTILRPHLMAFQRNK